MKDKNFNFGLLVILEIIEIGFGLLILGKINEITNFPGNLFESFDFVFAILIYTTFTFKSILEYLFLDKYDFDKSLSKKFWTMIILFQALLIIFLTLDLLSLREGKNINFSICWNSLVVSFALNIMIKYQKERVERRDAARLGKVHEKESESKKFPACKGFVPKSK